MFTPLQRFNVTTTSSNTKKKILYIAYFNTDLHRILLYLFSTNIIPRVSGTNEARKSDVYFSDQIVQEVPQEKCCHLVSIFIKHMWTVARSKKPHAFPYAQFLTIAFQKVRVNFFGLKPVIIKLTNALGQATCKRLRVSTDFGKNVVQGEGSGRQQQPGEELQAGAFTSQPLQLPTNCTHTPPPLPNTRPGWGQVIDMFNCFEKKIMQELQHQGERIEQLEAKLGSGVPPTLEMQKAELSGEGKAEELDKMETFVGVEFSCAERSDGSRAEEELNPVFARVEKFLGAKPDGDGGDAGDRKSVV